jgi:Domain of unknown function (DUF5753)
MPVAAGMQRQDVLGREEPPLLWALIDEAALHRAVRIPGIITCVPIEQNCLTSGLVAASQYGTFLSAADG